ncbi:hypothetical protein AVEN_153208-1 [Araneus ventricosus]|uniref:Uncharacterized protein n=1 Tax=Araneus ventricosus TaxID=182803 RepID=A0A4Y2TNH2_ARAVE|nr:hypothetical protein AVEN_153208-1 [Araneus ventricosus]
MMQAAFQNIKGLPHFGVRWRAFFNPFVPVGIINFYCLVLLANFQVCLIGRRSRPNKEFCYSAKLTHFLSPLSLVKSSKSASRGFLKRKVYENVLGRILPLFETMSGGCTAESPPCEYWCNKLGGTCNASTGICHCPASGTFQGALLSGPSSSPCTPPGKGPHPPANHSAPTSEIRLMYYPDDSQVSFWMYAMISIGTAFVIFVAVTVYLMCQLTRFALSLMHENDHHVWMKGLKKMPVGTELIEELPGMSMKIAMDLYHHHIGNRNIDAEEESGVEI